MSLPFGLSLEVFDVAASITIELPLVKFEGSARDVVEDIAVMGDDEKRAAETFAEMIFEPFDRGDVQMIRRFVQDREIGFADEQARQRNAPSLSPREHLDWALWVLDAEVVNNRLGFVYSLPTPESFDFFACGRLTPNQAVDLSAARVGQRRRQLVVSLLCSAPFDKTAEHDISHTLAGAKAGVLLEQVDPGAPATRDLTAVLNLDARENPAQGALAASAVADQAYSFTPANRQVDARENRAVCIALL